MKLLHRCLVGFVALLALVGFGSITYLGAQVAAGPGMGLLNGVPFARVMLTGGTGRAVAMPAGLYWKRINTSTTTVVKSSIGGLGCVVVGVAGAGNTLTLHNAPSTAGLVTADIIAVIDGAAVNEFCFGDLFSGGLVAVTAGGTPADYSISYR